MSESEEYRVNEAKLLLKALGLPSQQQNTRSALVLLALAKVESDVTWSAAKAGLHTTHELMAFIRKEYSTDYAANSRETIRRQTLHQFEQARLIDRNRDMPDRPTNSKDNNYSLNQEIIDILKEYPDGNWKKLVKHFQETVPSLIDRYKREREMLKLPVSLPNGKEITLSPGKHNQLHADIIHEFCSRFVKKSEVLYIGDTASSRDEGGKYLVLELEAMKALKIPAMSHDKLPDVVVYDSANDWLFLIEAVTAHGPVSSKRWEELESLFKDSPTPRVYVTAFPNAAEFRRYAADIAWETEVWIADNPTHMIHFNGDKFLGPHK